MKVSVKLEEVLKFDWRAGHPCLHAVIYFCFWWPEGRGVGEPGNEVGIPVTKLQILYPRIDWSRGSSRTGC